MALNGSEKVEHTLKGCKLQHMLTAIGQGWRVIIGRHQDDRLQIAKDDSSVIYYTQPGASAKVGCNKSSPDRGAVISAIRRPLLYGRRVIKLSSASLTGPFPLCEQRPVA